MGQNVKTLLSGDFSGFKKDSHPAIDINAIEKYNNLLEKNAEVQRAVSEATLDTNFQTRQLIMSANGATITEQHITAATEQYSLKAQAAALSTQALNIALNAGIWIAISLAVSAVVKAIDNYSHRLENAQAALEETQSELSTVNSELEETDKQIDNIQSKGTLILTDQDDLERLRSQNEELRLRQKYLEMQEQREKEKVAKYTQEKYAQKYGAGSTSRETINTRKNQITYPQRVDQPYSYLTGENNTTALPYAAAQQVHDAELHTLTDLIAKYEVYSEKRKQAIQNEDIKALNNYNSKLKDIEDVLITSRQELDEFRISMNDADEDNPVLDSIISDLNLIDHTLLSKSENLHNFIDTNLLDEAKAKLIELADNNKLTAKTLSKDFAQLDKYLQDNAITVDELIDEIKTLKKEAYKLPQSEIGFEERSITSTISLLDEMSEKWDSVNTLYQEFLENGTGKFENASLFSMVDAFSDIEKVDVKGFVSTLTNSASTAEDVQDAFDKLATEYIFASGCLAGLTDATAEQVVRELEAQGIANASALIYNYLGAQKAYAAETGRDLANATASEILTLIDEQTISAETAKAIAEYTLQKEYANGVTITTDGDIENIKSLMTACGKGVAAISAFQRAKAGLMETIQAGRPSNLNFADPLSAEDSQNKIAASIEAASRYKALSDAMEAEIQQNLAEVRSDIVQNSSGYKPPSTAKDKKGGGGKADSASNEKEFDWIERAFKMIEEERSKLESQSSSSFLQYLGLTEEDFDRAKELFSQTATPIGQDLNELATIASNAGLSIGQLYEMIQSGGMEESRRNALASIIDEDKIMLEQYAIAIEQYQKQYDEAAAKLSDDLREKVEHGNISSIETYSGEEAENIQAAIDAFDKLSDMKAKEYAQREKQKQNIINFYENEISALDAENERIANSNSLIEAQLGFMEESGQIVNAISYETIIENLKRQQAIIEKQLQKRRAELQALIAAGNFENTEEYYNLLEAINDCESSLYNLEEQQASYNNKLLQMPIDNMDTLISMYESITNTIQNWGNEVEAAGKKLDSAFYQSLIDNGMTLIHQYEEQADKIRDVMDEYEVGSEKWNELYAKLQSINSEMSSMIANLHEWNQKLLEMPLSSISSQIEGLQSVLEGLTSLQDDYDTVITAVTGAIAKQIKVLNDEKDAINDEYQSRMDTLQERLDLLNKQNEALQLQTDYEQALYDLQTANTQKTERVIRNGEVVYERNADNLRNAQEKVQDSLAALEEYKIQSEIDDLNDELEKINKRYDEQIEKLEKISEKWSQIKSDVENIQNGAVADEYLGAGWKDKVLAEDDADIYAAFKGNYETNAALIKQYETQIQTTQNIYDLLNSYIVAYKEGTLSYEQTVKGIQGILSQMNQDMTSGKNVQNILDFLAQANGSEATASSVLEGIQSSLTKSSDELIKSLEQYNENLALIADCTTSWEALTENVKGIRDILEEVRDNLEDAIDNYNEHSKKEEDVWDDEDEWRSSGVVGPGDTANDHYTGGGGYVDSGPGVYADGIKKGLVGTSDPHKTGEQIKLLATEDLAPDAVPVIAHRYEAILNQPQQQKLLENFEKARYTPVLNLPKLNMANTMPPSNGNIVINMGDIKLTDVRDVDGFAKAMAANFESSMRQALGRMR